MKGLTTKQVNILDFISEFQRREGMAPTVQELAAYFHIRPPTAFAHLRALLRKGFVARSGKARSLTVIRNPAGRTRTTRRVDAADLTEIPLLGRVAAGATALAEQEVEGHLRLDPACFNHHSREPVFALRVFGESMRDLGLLDGDMVLARKTPVATTGDIVIAIVDNETTVKTLFLRQDNQVELRPANPAFPVQLHRARKVAIQGVVIGLLRCL
ncbi:MAG: transcriptional repressor LexA [bacterium]